MRATTPRAAPGRYRLLFEPLTGAAPARLAAERAMTAAGRGAGGDREDRRRALASYRLAVDAWRARGDRRGEARAIHAMALLLKDLREGGGAEADPGELFRRAADLWNELGEPGLQALALAEIGIAELQRGAADEARALLHRALELNLETGQAFEAAGNRMDLGYVAQRQGALREAQSSYEQALGLYRDLGDSTWVAVLLGNLGGVHWQLGEATPAFDYYRQSLAMRRAAGDRKQEARMLNNLAALHRSLGEVERALELYDQAEQIYSQLDDRRGQARILNNTGYAYRELGELDRARGYFHRALELRRELGDRRGASATLGNLGDLHDRRGETLEALGYYRRSLELKQALGDLRGESTMASLIGWTLARLGREQDAREYLSQAQRLLDGLENRAAEAWVRARRAEALLELGDVESAHADAEEALSLYRHLGRPVARAEALMILARTQRARGHLAEARSALEDALAIVEDLRAGLGNPAFRETFLSSRTNLWELHVDLLMEMHERDPGAGLDEAALEAAEHARARGLLDLLAEAGAELHRGFDPRLIERRRQLVQRLILLAGRPGRADASQTVRVAAIEQTRKDLDLVEAEMRRRHPRFAAMDRHRPLDAAAMQRLLGDRDLLLYYALGEERSFLWAVSGQRIEAFELPPRQRLEDAARHAHRELATRLVGQRAAETAVTDLGRLVLGPVAGRLGQDLEIATPAGRLEKASAQPRRRLLVVADGALHWVPFAALPLPAGGAARAELSAAGRLLEHYEVTHLPSISVLAARAGLPSPSPPASRPTPGRHSVAVVADPVFDTCDPRIRTGAGPCDRQPGDESTETRYARLRGSRREAEAIAALAGGDALLALDFDAGRELVTGGRLEPYRFVHFATHGVVDTENPRLSGLVLSGSDAEGRSRDGVLRLADIYNLELNADLVVLSGCRTAAGREIRGEGLVGLVRGFLYAGARQVVASLWQVDDATTVELMHGFYRALLADGLAPAAALRVAQLGLAHQPGTSDPYYWAGFVVQGGK